MTTVLYKPDEFAACDSAWSVNGHPIYGIEEQKFIFFPSRSDGTLHLAIMCGSHIAITLQQALFLQVISSNQYASLQTLYLAEFDMEIDTAIFNLTTGQLRSVPHAWYPIGKHNGSCSMGTGGHHASHFYYHSSRWACKNRRKVPTRKLIHDCTITGSIAYACSQDSATGGKINKIEWSRGCCVCSNILPLPENYLNAYSSTLRSTMKEINDMYETLKTPSPQASNAREKMSRKPQQTRNAEMGAAAAPEATRLTMSRVLGHIRLFESL